jgi:hypothetical protein
LTVSMKELEAFWEICGGATDALTRVLAAPGVADYGRCDGPVPRTQPPPLTSSRSVKLGCCPMSEWPDEVYEDESLTLPAITAIELTGGNLQEPRRMSAYGQAKFVRKCINLKYFRWTGGDSRSDTARTQRLSLQRASETAWFFEGLLGDTPSLQGQYGWKHHPDEKWPLPHLESIDIF